MKRDDLRGWHAGVLGIATVERATHTTHHCDNLLPDRKLAAWRGSDNTCGLDAQHTRKGHTFSKTKPRVEFGAIKPKRFHADQYPTWVRLGNGQFTDLKRVWRP